MAHNPLHDVLLLFYIVHVNIAFFLFLVLVIFILVTILLLVLLLIAILLLLIFISVTCILLLRCFLLSILLLIRNGPFANLLWRRGCGLLCVTFSLLCGTRPLFLGLVLLVSWLGIGRLLILSVSLSRIIPGGITPVSVKVSTTLKSPRAPVVSVETVISIPISTTTSESIVWKASISVVSSSILRPSVSGAAPSTRGTPSAVLLRRTSPSRPASACLGLFSAARFVAIGSAHLLAAIFITAIALALLASSSTSLAVLATLVGCT
mmetsp:Transcript_33288/g.77829  ORF Transcript_33288/g.77829 Transcript_33288/m.77829 type:complete len:265 (+) Transcript_33288:1277-2071(+)